MRTYVATIDRGESWAHTEVVKRCVASSRQAAEAAAEGGVAGGGTVEGICEQGAGYARELLDAEDEESRMEG